MVMIPILLKDGTYLFIKWDDKDKLIEVFTIKSMIFLDFYEVNPENKNQLCPSLTQGINRDFILDIQSEVKWDILPYSNLEIDNFEKSLDFIKNSTNLKFNLEDLK